MMMKVQYVSASPPGTHRDCIAVPVVKNKQTNKQKTCMEIYEKNWAILGQSELPKKGWYSTM